MKNFYTGLEERAFWKSAVEKASHFTPHDIYRKRWAIEKDFQIAAAGSCFAQHISRHLRANGYRLMDVEPAPSALDPIHYDDFGYQLYSGRYGNIYTTRQLLQLVEETFARRPAAPVIWEKDGRFFDAKRPRVEPGGYTSEAELRQSRAYHLAQLRTLFENFDVFIFTLGLTEAWAHRKTGQVVPVAPGVLAGETEIGAYQFLNFSFPEVIDDFRAVMKLLDRHRSKPARYILTVSPVPLTATASGNHVLPATTYSKSVLRAAAGYLFEQHANIDYFPSYEIITNPSARGTFFTSNLRSVAPEGVEVVMREFFRNHPPIVDETAARGQKKGKAKAARDVQCEEALLEAFGR